MPVGQRKRRDSRVRRDEGGTLPNGNQILPIDRYVDAGAESLLAVGGEGNKGVELEICVLRPVQISSFVAHPRVNGAIRGVAPEFGKRLERPIRRKTCVCSRGAAPVTARRRTGVRGGRGAAIVRVACDARVVNSAWIPGCTGVGRRC